MKCPVEIAFFVNENFATNSHDCAGFGEAVGALIENLMPQAAFREGFVLLAELFDCAQWWCGHGKLQAGLWFAGC